MKKILFVAHEWAINGASYSLLNLIDQLQDKCEFIVISPCIDGPFVEELKKRKLKIYYVPFLRWVDIKNKEFLNKKIHFKKIHKYNLLLCNKICEILKDENIDIIHSNTSVIDFGYLISKKLNIPHVWHIREFGEKDFSMYPLCSYKQYYKKISDNNYIICISNEVQKKFKDKVNDNRIKVIYNGVSKNNINENKNYHKDKNEKLICLQSGMIKKTKGQDITIKAISKLVEEGKNIELLIAGRGDIKDLGINPEDKKWLKILGQVDNLNKIRKNVDIEIVSSKSEAFGRVTVEAMMGGLTVVGSNTGATKELIKDNKTGLLFESCDYISLYEKIKYLYNNRILIEKIGQSAYDYSKDYFLIDRCANEIYNFYLQILKQEGENNGRHKKI